MHSVLSGEPQDVNVRCNISDGLIFLLKLIEIDETSSQASIMSLFMFRKNTYMDMILIGNFRESCFWVFWGVFFFRIKI